jgi:hypothetical protein
MMTGASSGGAPASGTLPTASVDLGEAPPGEESTWEAAQRRGVSGGLAKKAAACFGASKGSPRRGFYRGRAQHVV